MQRSGGKERHWGVGLSRPATFTRFTRRGIEGLVAFLAKRRMHGDANEVGRSNVPADTPPRVRGRSGDVAEVARPRTWSPVAVPVWSQGRRGRGGLVTGGSGRVGRMRAFARERKIITLKFGLAHEVWCVKVGERGKSLDVGAYTVVAFSSDGKLDNAPELYRGNVVERRVEPKDRATPYAGEGWEAEGNAGSDVRMRVEE